MLVGIQNYRHLKHRIRHKYQFKDYKVKGNQDCGQRESPQLVNDLCKLVSSRVARIVGFKNSIFPTEPVTIITKTMFAELTLDDLIIYQDQDKKMKIMQRGLWEIIRIITPKSFQKDNHNVNCFQLQLDKNSCQRLIKIDSEQLEPEDQNENIIGLCFDSQENMDAFIKAIQNHRDQCQDQKTKIQIESHQQFQKVQDLNKMEGMDQITLLESEVNSVVNQAKELKESLEKLENQKEKIKEKYELQNASESDDRSNQMEIDSKQIQSVGQPDTCKESVEAVGLNDHDCAKPLQDLDKVQYQKDIDYSHIENNPKLSKAQKEEKKVERLNQWLELQKSKNPKRMSQSKGGAQIGAKKLSRQKQTEQLKMSIKMLLDKLQKLQKISKKQKKRRR